MPLFFVLLLGFVISCDNKAESERVVPVARTTIADVQESISIPDIDAWDSVVVDSGLVESWLLLRNAAELEDSVQRASIYVRVRLPVARERIPWVEAKALEKFKNYKGALAVYERLDAPVDVFRMRALLASKDTSALDSIRRELLTFLVRDADTWHVRPAISLFDSLFKDPTAEESLEIAHAAADIGMSDRAISAFQAADRINPLSVVDRRRYADSYFRLRQFSTAATEYAKITSPRPNSAAARYQRARAFVSMGRVNEAMTQLRAIDNAYPADTSAASALMLLADLLSDRGQETESRSLLRDLVSRFPDSRFARQARFDIALSSFVLKDFESATTEFRSLLNSPDSIAARYWLGRTKWAMSDTVLALEAWRTVLMRDSTSYYAALAARRLNTTAVRFPREAVTYPASQTVDSAMKRIEVLKALGMFREVGYENARLFQDAPVSKERLLATASAFAGTDQAGRAIALGRRALSNYGPSIAVYRLIYPVANRALILERATKSGIDPILIASLIRQESNFNPGAVSPVGARGLMQLMPNVAAEIAKNRGVTPWSADYLYNPEINIDFGIAHLAPLIRRQSNIIRALAAYNAGESRVNLWSKKVGASDPEVFTERIPLAETRGYVKNILRNREFYRALYTW